MKKNVGSMSHGQAHEILLQIEKGLKDICIDPGDQAKNIIYNKYFFAAAQKYAKPILKRLPWGMDIKIEDPNERYGGVDEPVFKFGDIKDLGINSYCQPSVIELQQYVVIDEKPKTLSHLFSFINPDLRKLALNPKQIRKFAIHNRRSFFDRSTFLLYEDFSLQRIKAVSIGNVANGDIGISECDLGWFTDWGFKDCRLIVPKLF